MAKVTIDTEEFKRGIDDAIDKASSASGKIGSFFGMAAKVATAAISAMSAATSAAIGASISKFGDYEQLIGGAETLFKSSSGKVIEYAQQAYRDAGMSANEYLDTVNGISAALVNSLANAGNEVTEISKEELKKRIENVKGYNERKLDEIKDAHEKEIDDFRELTDEKIALIDKQYRESLKNIDEEKYNQLSAIDNQIDLLNRQTAEEEKALKKQEIDAKKADYEKRIRQARGYSEQRKIEKEYHAFLEKLAAQEAKEKRKAQIDDLKKQKEEIKKSFDSRKKAIEEQHKREIEEVKKQAEEELKIKKQAQEEQLRAEKEASRQRINYVREEAEAINSATAETQKATAETYEQAAEISHMMVRDMADNANKMGTSLSSIQYAYSGFAKQNYSMLDNLKLGFGGNKAEMERLLEQAEQLTGRKFDLSSFADIVEAIHAIQDEMGITGTTADEAEKTIQGSAASMKAAFDNLLTGLADDSADIQELFTNLEETAETFSSNIEPRINQALQAISELIETRLPGIVERIPGIVTEKLPDIINAGIAIVASLASGIVENLPELINTVFSMTEKILNKISESAPDMLEKGSEIVLKIAEGISDNLPEIITSAADLIVTLSKALSDPENLANIIQAGLDIVIALGEGLISAIPNLVLNSHSLTDKLFDSFFDIDWSDVGTRIDDAILSGLKKAWNNIIDWVNEKIQGINKATGFLNDTFGWDIGQIGTIGGRYKFNEDTGARMRGGGGGSFGSAGSTVIQNFYNSNVTAADAMEEAQIATRKGKMQGVYS